MVNEAKRVLVAVNPLEAIGIAEVLRREGHTVIVAVTRRDAVHFASTWQPHLIVCDGGETAGAAEKSAAEAPLASWDIPTLFVEDVVTEDELFRRLHDALKLEVQPMTHEFEKTQTGA